MKLVVGLGNPGRKYAGTRHNVGFEVLADLARRYSATTSSMNDAEVADVVIGGERVFLCAPQTFMNLSGRAVRQIADFYKIEAEDLLVVCDDLNLPCGRLRLRGKGSAGGQKGLADIIQRLGTNEFARLRIGIGSPPPRMDGAAFVLAKFLPEERSVIDEAVLRAADGVEAWVRDGTQRAMNTVNAPEPDTESENL